MHRAWVFVTLVLTASCSSGSTGGPTIASGCARMTLPPVLFVHGSGLSSGSWAAMRQTLLQHGYPTEFLHAIDLEPNDGDNIHAAETAIRNGVEELLADANQAAARSECSTPAAEKVVLVGHSMGAVSSRWFAAHIAPHRVQAIVSLAGANHGTDALCGLAGAGNEQMCPSFASSSDESSLQFRLNGSPAAPLDETPYGIGPDEGFATRVPPDERRRILYLAVFLEPDEWIVPTESAWLDGAGGIDGNIVSTLPLERVREGNYRLTARSSHDGLPAHPAIIQFVQHALVALAADSVLGPQK